VGVDEGMCVSLRFPAGGVAQLSVSIGAAPVESYRAIGEKGSLRVEPCFGVSTFTHYLTSHGRTNEHSFSKRDQFAPELIYFSRCILEDREPEPSGEEGWCDVRVACAAFESVRTGRAIPLTPFLRRARPDFSQNIHKPFVEPPRPIGAPAPILTVR
jgi:predicted dehydrogenase